MATQIRCAALALLVGLAACSGGQQPEPRTPPPDAQRVDAAKAGNVAGRVTIDGPVPENARIKMAADPVCARANENGATFETFVSDAGGLGNVFVYVKDGLGKYYFDTPSEPVTLNQQGCHYAPHVFGIRVGQPLQIVNSDPTMHNVHAMPTINREFNFGQPIQGQKQSKSFTEPEVMVRFKCDVHSWMSAYAGVLEHPYFAVTRPDGAFELKDLPAGTYTIEAWHEQLGTQARSVTLGENEKKDLTFTFKAPAAAS
jgi:hypothetical protein